MALGPSLPSAPKSLWSPAELRGSHGQEHRLGSPKTHVQIPACSLPVASRTSMKLRPSSVSWDNAHICSLGLLESERDPARGWHTEPAAASPLGQRCKVEAGRAQLLRPCLTTWSHGPSPRPGLALRPLDGGEDRTLCGAAKGTTPCLFSPPGTPWSPCWTVYLGENLC